MKTFIALYLIGYLIIITIAWIRYVKYEGIGTMMVISSVFLLVYPFILLALAIEKTKELIKKH